MKLLYAMGLVMSALLLVATVEHADASCEDARLAILRNCGCNADRDGNEWRNRGRYAACVRQASNGLRNGRAIAAECKTALDRCAGRSVCGAPGAVVCVVGNQCFVAADETRCARKGGTVSAATSCCDVSL